MLIEVELYCYLTFSQYKLLYREKHNSLNIILYAKCTLKLYYYALCIFIDYSLYIPTLVSI